MRIRSAVLLVTLLLVSSVFGSALGSGEPRHVNLAEAKPEDPIEADGIISTFGSEPHTYLGMRTDETLIRLDGPKEILERLRSLQGSRIGIRGVFVSLSKGPGFPAVVIVEEISVLQE